MTQDQQAALLRAIAETIARFRVDGTTSAVHVPIHARSKADNAEVLAVLLKSAAAVILHAIDRKWVTRKSVLEMLPLSIMHAFYKVEQIAEKGDLRQ